MAITQNPSSPALEIGFGTGSISIMIRGTQNETDSAEIEYIKSESGDDAVAIIGNQGKRITVDGYLLELSSTTTLPTKGSTVSIGSIAYLVEAVDIRRTSKAARISMTLYKPTATTWE